MKEIKKLKLGKFRLYPKIYTKQNKSMMIQGIDWNKPVLVEEKYDGVNVAIHYTLNGEFEYYTNDYELGKYPTGDFIYLENYKPELTDYMKLGNILFCEFIGLGKLPYNKTHKELRPFEMKDVASNGMFITFAENIIYDKSKGEDITTVLEGETGFIKDRDELVAMVNSGKILSKIDGKTPIEGIIVKQLNDNGNVIAREKICIKIKGEKNEKL